MSVTGNAATITYAGSGNFSVTINGQTQTLNLADLNTMVRMEQIQGMDQTIADQLQEITAKNEKRKALNELLAKMRQYKSEGKDDDFYDGDWDTENQSGAAGSSTGNNGSERFVLEGQGTTARSVDGWMDYFGLTKTDVQQHEDGTKRDSQWDANIEAVKGEVNNITTESESDMLRFRQMVDKRSTGLQEAKTTLTNDKRVKDNIVS